MSSRRKSSIVPLILIGCAVAASGCSADANGNQAAPGSVVRLEGDQGLRPYTHAGGARTIDARSAVFTVANSRNSAPGAGATCKQGALPTNPYPVTIQGAAGVTLSGGLFLSRVPQNADWTASYCNSAAILFKQAPDGIVGGVRISGAWDAVRASSGSTGLTLRNSWISDVRDDVLENDYLYAARIDDTLVDGAFQGISIKPGSRSTIADASREIVHVSGLLLRLREYPYKGEMRFGALSKNDLRSPRLSIRNSIVAVDYRGGKTFRDYWERSWAKLAGGSDNAFLWLSDAPIPADFPLPPDGFEVFKGSAARDIWNAAKANWINCHPGISRLASDARSVVDRCEAKRWGGRRE